MSTLGSLPPDIARRRVLGTKDAAEFLGLPLRTLRWMRQRGALPDAVKLSERKIGFRVGDLSDFLDCREAGREWKDCRGASRT
ncbi:helix-turn-helix transcriptional regulator [Methylobacterium aerolatum]|nr:helix-turn-helix domain-containing protein [Methylobacterium aerolatum]